MVPMNLPRPGKSAHRGIEGVSLEAVSAHAELFTETFARANA